MLERALPGLQACLSPGSSGVSREPENCQGPSLVEETQLHGSDGDMLPAAEQGGLWPPDRTLGELRRQGDSSWTGLSSQEGSCL